LLIWDHDTLIPMKSRRPEIPPQDAQTKIAGHRGHYLFGRAAYPVGGRYGPRIQKAFQLVALTAGGLQLTVDGRSFDLLPGQAVLLHPGREEIYRFSNSTPSVHTWCELSPRRVSPTHRRIFLTTTGVHPMPAGLHALIHEGLALQESSAAAYHESSVALALSCLLRFAAEASTSRSLAKRPTHPGFERALAIGRSEFPALSTATQLAERAGLSPSHLRALFVKHFHESPTSFLWRLKVGHAVQLVRSTGLTLSEIADQCGFANPFHLSRAIKKTTGTTPRLIRTREWR
jgi:AraC family transcriptional regulator of arabinose operon